MPGQGHISLDATHYSFAKKELELKKNNKKLNSGLNKEVRQQNITIWGVFEFIIILVTHEKHNAFPVLCGS